MGEPRPRYYITSFDGDKNQIDQVRGWATEMTHYLFDLGLEVGNIESIADGSLRLVGDIFIRITCPVLEKRKRGAGKRGRRRASIGHYSKVLEMRYRENMEVKEIAKKFGVSTQAIYEKLKRAEKIISELYQERRRSMDR